MIQHIVMFRLKETADGKGKEENLSQAMKRLQDFDKKIPQLMSFQVVVNAPDAPESNYDIALICQFEDMESLNAYQVHPEHVKFGEFIGRVKESRACIDFAC